jgi:hypothetical protein
LTNLTNSAGVVGAVGVVGAGVVGAGVEAGVIVAGRIKRMAIAFVLHIKSAHAVLKSLHNPVLVKYVIL